MQFDRLGNTCVIGLQWGDEGKGKIVDTLMEHFDVVVRYSGGANAGHTIVVDNDRFALHQLPSGVLHEHVTCMITCGSVIDPAVLIGELESLRERGYDVMPRLRISGRAQLVFPYHRRQDILAERLALPGGRIGTTARGIGPCYADKVSRRWGIRVCELYNAERLRTRLADIIAHKNAYLNALYDVRDPLDPQVITDEYLAFAERLRPSVCDTTLELNRLIREGKRILFEGSQGSLLDIDHGTYPYVTSSSAGVGGVSSGAGVPPTAIQSTVGVIKAYSTRVGEGPMPTEQHGDVGNLIRENGKEYGTTTGRPRRCGWFDAAAVAYSATFSGPTHLALMKLDTLTGLDELRICTAYRHAGKTLNSYPPDTYTLAEVEPVYETLPGWCAPIDHCRAFDELPDAAQAYVRRIGELAGAPIRMIGVGPSREQTILLESE